jgi:alkylhydroperoxidase family enzyme
MALSHGVRAEQINQLDTWETSDEFDEEERAVLRFVEAVATSNVDDRIFADIASRFSAAGAVELTLTASFYHCVLPRVVQAFEVELETQYKKGAST